MTLKDIAQKAGVSVMTVSNVINGKHNHVSKKTIQKVNEIIKKYNYVPNLSARTLSNKKSNIIGVIIPPDPETHHINSLENPYISTMLGIIEYELRLNGYYTMVRSLSQKSDAIKFLKNWNVDGMIFLHPNETEEIRTFIETSSCPIAMFDTEYELPNLINISSNDKKGVYLSTKYLIERGHTHIACVIDYNDSIILENRFLGYKQALEEFQIPFRPEYVYPYFPSYENGQKAGREISNIPSITAVVTPADICAIGIMEGARQNGYTLPNDLSIIGYDDLSLCQYLYPKLTSVSQNVTEKAILATKLLIKKIYGETITTSKIKTDVTIVERDSVLSLPLL